MKPAVYAAVLTAVLLTGCGKEEERKPIPQLETAPPRVTANTYTGTTVEFYTATTTEPAHYGTVTANTLPGADTAIAFPDFAAETADTGIMGGVTADTAGISPDTADFAPVTADFGAANADTADFAADYNYIQPDTADTNR